jgi:hypothetical protein
LALGDPFVALPAIIAGQVDVIPSERGDGREEGILDWLVPAQSGDRAFEIDGVPEHDSGGDQIEAAGPVALISNDRSRISPERGRCAPRLC